MAEGTNLRGKRAIKMFKRNFKRSRLGNASFKKGSSVKKNVDVIFDKNNDTKENLNE